MASKIVLSITDISSTGEGIAKYNGKVYFVHGAYPSQTVEALILQEKKRYTLCKALQVLEDACTQRPFLCPHQECGGCHLRAIPYKEQCTYKENILQTSFSKIAKIDTIHPLPIRAMDSPYSYRLRADFHYGYTKDGRQDIGFYVHNSHTIIPITHCAIVPSPMMVILSIARKSLRDSHLDIYHNGTGFWRHLVVRYSTAEDSFLIHCITADIPYAYHHVHKLFSALQEAFPSARCIHSIRKSKSRIAQGEQYITEASEAFLSESITLHDTSIRIAYGANSFFQNNYAILTELFSTIATLCTTQTSYLDICTGVGSIALTAFPHESDICGIDYIGESITYAKKNANINNKKAIFIAKDMKMLDIKDIHGKHIISVDPPRGGLHPHLIDILLKAPTIEKIIYVSCNPATLARDCALLQPIYTVQQSTPFDMFPHTIHCESLTLLERR